MFMESSDGVHWSEWQRLAAIEEGHYQVSAVKRTRGASAFNYHPARVGLNGRTNLYYLETPDGGESWQTAAGKNLQLPLDEVHNAALVYDFIDPCAPMARSPAMKPAEVPETTRQPGVIGRAGVNKSEGKLVYMKDLVFDSADRPAILIVTSNGYESGPKNGSREWRLVRWNGRRWVQTGITKSDSNYDMGSLYVNGSTWRLIAPTATGPQAYNPGGEMCLWESRDDGETWDQAKSLTRGTASTTTPTPAGP